MEREVSFFLLAWIDGIRFIAELAAVNGGFRFIFSESVRILYMRSERE